MAALAEKLEAASLTRAKNAVAALLALAPQEATVIADDGSEASGLKLAIAWAKYEEEDN